METNVIRNLLKYRESKGKNTNTGEAVELDNAFDYFLKIKVGSTVKIKCYISQKDKKEIVKKINLKRNKKNISTLVFSGGRKEPMDDILYKGKTNHEYKLKLFDLLYSQ